MIGKSARSRADSTRECAEALIMVIRSRRGWSDLTLPGKGWEAGVGTTAG